MDNRKFDSIRDSLLKILPRVKNFIFTESWPSAVRSFPLVIEYRGARGFPEEVGADLIKICSFHEDISAELCEETFVTLAFRSKEKRDAWAKFFSEMSKKEELRSAIIKDRDTAHRILEKYMLL